MYKPSRPRKTSPGGSRLLELDHSSPQRLGSFKEESHPQTVPRPVPFPPMSLAPSEPAAPNRKKELKKSLNSALTLAALAVKQDGEGDFKSSMKTYSESIKLLDHSIALMREHPHASTSGRDVATEIAQLQRIRDKYSSRIEDHRVEMARFVKKLSLSIPNTSDGYSQYSTYASTLPTPRTPISATGLPSAHPPPTGPLPAIPQQTSPVTKSPTSPTRSEPRHSIIPHTDRIQRHPIQIHPRPGLPTWTTVSSVEEPTPFIPSERSLRTRATSPDLSASNSSILVDSSQPDSARPSLDSEEYGNEYIVPFPPLDDENYVQAPQPSRALSLRQGLPPTPKSSPPAVEPSKMVPLLLRSPVFPSHSPPRDTSSTLSEARPVLANHHAKSHPGPHFKHSIPTQDLGRLRPSSAHAGQASSLSPIMPSPVMPSPVVSTDDETVAGSSIPPVPIMQAPKKRPRTAPGPVPLVSFMTPPADRSSTHSPLSQSAARARASLPAPAANAMGSSPQLVLTPAPPVEKTGRARRKTILLTTGDAELIRPEMEEKDKRKLPPPFLITYSLKAIQTHRMSLICPSLTAPKGVPATVVVPAKPNESLRTPYHLFRVVQRTLTSRPVANSISVTSPTTPPQSSTATTFRGKSLRRNPSSQKLNLSAPSTPSRSRANTAPSSQVPPALNTNSSTSHIPQPHPPVAPPRGAFITPNLFVPSHIWHDPAGFSSVPNLGEKVAALQSLSDGLKELEEASSSAFGTLTTSSSASPASTHIHALVSAKEWITALEKFAAGLVLLETTFGKKLGVCEGPKAGQAVSHPGHPSVPNGASSGMTKRMKEWSIRVSKKAAGLGTSTSGGSSVVVHNGTLAQVTELGKEYNHYLRKICWRVVNVLDPHIMAMLRAMSVQQQSRGSAILGSTRAPPLLYNPHHPPVAHPESSGSEKAPSSTASSITSIAPSTQVGNRRRATSSVASRPLSTQADLALSSTGAEVNLGMVVQKYTDNFSLKSLVNAKSVIERISSSFSLVISPFLLRDITILLEGLSKTVVEKEKSKKEDVECDVEWMFSVLG